MIDAVVAVVPVEVFIVEQSLQSTINYKQTLVLVPSFFFLFFLCYLYIYIYLYLGFCANQPANKIKFANLILSFFSCANQTRQLKSHLLNDLSLYCRRGPNVDR